MISSTRCAMLDLLVAARGPTAQHLPQEAALHLQRAAGHDVVERAHALEQRDVLEGARDAAAGGLDSGRIWARRLPLKVMRALLRVVEAVDDVEHRGLAGAVRTDDGAHLALPDVERHVA